MSNREKRYRIPANVLWREEKDRIVLFNEESGEPYLLNEIGTSIWKLCVQEKTQAEIISVMLENYEGNYEQISRETQQFLSNLCKAGFLNEVKHAA
ncbi:MAG: PqqD family protein [Candidatus Zhuqueibacterota bacterium]